MWDEEKGNCWQRAVLGMEVGTGGETSILLQVVALYSASLPQSFNLQHPGQYTVLIAQFITHYSAADLSSLALQISEMTNLLNSVLQIRTGGQSAPPNWLVRRLTAEYDLSLRCKDYTQ